MNYKRAISTGLLVYITSFIFGGLVGLLLGFDMSETDLANIPTPMWYASAFIAIALSAGGAWWYFRSPSTEASVKNGAILGIVFVLVGFVMDVIMFLPLASEGMNPLKELGKYYSQPIFWGTLLLVILSAIYVGNSLQNKKIKL